MSGRVCASPAWLMVGLGNPGGAYHTTRHNLGFWVIEEIADRAGVSLWENSVMMARAPAQIGATAVMLVKPLGWMNRSGGAVSSALSSTGLPPERLVVVCDDVALPDGRIRMRTGGSSGGHKGLASIIEAVGTDEFVRVRIGVGSFRTGEDDLSDFVLRPLTGDEQRGFVLACRQAAEMIESCVQQGAFSAMTLDSMRARLAPEGEDSPGGAGLS